MNVIVNTIETHVLILPLPEVTEILIKASLGEHAKTYQRVLRKLEVWLSGRPLSDALLATYITEIHMVGKSSATIAQTVAAVKWQLKHQSQKAVNLPTT